MKVPFLDLNSHHKPHREEYLKAIEEVIDCGAFAGGKYVEAFEEAFAEYCGTEFAIGAGSGTETLWLILKALGIGSGDEVITTPSTFFATAEAISHAGAKPVFVDVCKDTCNLDPNALEEAINSRTKAIIPVHLFGQPADMDPIRTIAEDKGVYVVEDAAQAHGANYRGERAGSIGIAGSFSFYPGKNLGAFGEAGAVTTNDSEVAERIRMLRDHGQAEKYYHDLIGWNARMDGIQGAILRIKLENLDWAISKRSEHADRYIKNLKSVSGIQLPHVIDEVDPVWHLFVVRAPDRVRFMKYLEKREICCGIHYPIPVHLQKAYRHLGGRKGDFPVAERWADQCVSLPMYPELTPEQVDYVISSIKDYSTIATPELALA